MTTRRALVCLLGFGLAASAFTEERIADIRQGTNLALSLAPDGTALVIDLLGQLWSLPAAGGGAEPLTSPGETARNPRHSPDGRSVVYQRRLDGQWDLWLLDVATGERRALTATPTDEREPDFSPDGGSVVFVANDSGHDCLWTIDLTSGVRSQLTEEPGEASFPTLSADGLIAYVLDRPGQSTLRVLTGSVSREVFASPALLGPPSWRPGGGVLVFGMRESIATSRLQMLILSDPPVRKPISAGEDVFRSRAAWPSSGELIYAADGQIWRRGLAEAERRPVHLFAAVAVEAQAPPANLGSLDAPAEYPVQGIGPMSRSADGKRAVFTALGDLWLLERGSARRLTDDPYVDLDAVFTPSGDAVVFASDRSGALNLWQLSLDGGALVPLSSGEAKSFRPAVSPDGTRVAFLETSGLGPWAPADVKLLSIAVPEAVETLATGVVAAGRPEFAENGRTITVPIGNGETGLTRAALQLELAPEGIHRTTIPLPPPEATAASGNDVGAAPELEAAAALTWRPTAPPPPYVLEVGRLFDGVRGTYHRHVDIHVVEGRIAAIVGRGVLPAPGRVIDARDATVIPGLIDVHAHQSALAGERLGRAWLAFGVTAVREVAADLPEALERGEAWASGRRAGPRLLITPGMAPPATVRAAPVPIQLYPGIAAGFGHDVLSRARELGLSIGRSPAQPMLPELSGTPRGYEIETSASYVSYQDSLSRLIASSTVLTPALAAIQGLQAGNVFDREIREDAAYRLLFGAGERDRWASSGLLPQAVPSLQQTVARLVRSGGRVAVGSDAPAVPYGLGLHLELALLAGAGLPNDQVLRLATVEGALALGLEQQIGTLEPGKLADFVVLDGDPLMRISDTLKIVAVSKGGTWIERQRLLIAP